MPALKGIWFSNFIKTFLDGKLKIFDKYRYALLLCLYIDNARILSSTVNRRPRGFNFCVRCCERKNFNVVWLTTFKECKTSDFFAKKVNLFLEDILRDIIWSSCLFTLLYKNFALGVRSFCLLTPTERNSPLHAFLFFEIKQ